MYLAFGPRTERDRRAVEDRGGLHSRHIGVVEGPKSFSPQTLQHFPNLKPFIHF